MSQADATVMEVEGGGEGETFEVGKTYAVKLSTGIEFNGIVLGYDSNPNFVIFQDGTTPETGDTMTTRMVDAKFITKLRFLGKVKDPLASKKRLVDIDGLIAKVADAIREIERIGDGVTAETQSMFDALSKTQIEGIGVGVTEEAQSMFHALSGGSSGDSPGGSSGSSGGSSGSGGSGSGSKGSDDSNDSAHFGVTSACVLIQWSAIAAFKEGKRARLTTDRPFSDHTTLFSDAPSYLLNNFNAGWNSCVDNLSPLNSIDMDDVTGSIRAASYSAGLILDSLYDQTPQRLPTSEYQNLFNKWLVAGFMAGRYMIEQFRYEKEMQLVDFTEFFTNDRF